MRYIWQQNWFFIPVVVFFILCGTVALSVPYSRELLFFNDLRHEPFNSLFLFLTQCGEVWAFAVFGVAAFFWKPRYTFIIATVGLLALPVGYFFKDVIGVDRPITYLEKMALTNEVVLVPSVELNRGQTSFPSGHTMAAFALYSLLALMAGRRYERWGLLFALMAMLVGISRIFLVQHFLVDVMAGAFLGLILSGIVWFLAQKWLPEKRFN